ncbi:CTP synthetase [Halorubrum salinarum]|uniref:CTP synthetase n=1 Tax=Halorubrum salinarum TaxID=2739057 RepID=A0A7D4D3M8_9EURY|nr:CTP synthetase [Halorubrum salinarum]QKG92742.1 CTP synthetase [Halorubrum salinarum]
MAEPSARPDGGRAEGQLAVVAGPDQHGLGEELAALGVEVRRIEGLVTASKLEDAGVADAAYFVLTDVEEATGIPVAKELNPEVRVVTYASRSLPEFVATVADLAVDPGLLDAATVAEELLSDDGEP